LPLFQKLSEHYNLDLTIIFLSSSEKNRKWQGKLKNKFKFKILNGFTLNIYKGDQLIPLHFNPSIVKELFRGKYDVVISGGYASFTNQLAFLICKFANVKFALWSESTKNESGILRKLFRPLIRAIVRGSDAIIVPGVAARDYIISEGGDSDSIFVSPFNCVENETFVKMSRHFEKNKSKIKEKFGISSKKVILYVGQLVSRKNPELLIKSYSNVIKHRKDVALILVGDGPLKKKLLKIKQNLGLNDVIFAGYVPDEALYRFYSISDIFVLPSKQEVWGLVLNEAMASGLPIITTNLVGASGDLVVNGYNGIIIREITASQLTKTLLYLLKNENIRKELGNNARNTVLKNFNYERATEWFIESIEFAISAGV
jgi:glycosyltransferase involved in cell wall biosynthesis